MASRLTTNSITISVNGDFFSCLSDEEEEDGDGEGEKEVKGKGGKVPSVLSTVRGSTLRVRIPI